MPDPQAVSIGRFLEQSTYGPTPALMTRARQIGMSAFIDEQFATPESTWPTGAKVKMSDAVDAFFANALNGQDQLRQRIIGALSEIFVISKTKNNTSPNQIVPWLQVLSRNAFGNYRTLLTDVTLDASMGRFLDLVNSGVAGGAANENYPRELMELFTLGVSLLNVDGSVQVDAEGVPLPTYSQADVRQLAKALTGWTYQSSKESTTSRGGNQQYFPGPMIPCPTKHDTSAKTVLGQLIAASQSVRQDLDSALDIIFTHPNIGPFVATRLIRALVTSNPSPAYIARIAQVFNGTQSNVRGDMQATIRAILLDPDARNDNPPSDFGRLRPPMQHTIALARALNIDPGPASKQTTPFAGMDEKILDAPTVFAHYSPLHHIPDSPLFGPEFQIYSTSDAVNRANFFYTLISRPGNINPALQSFVSLAANPSNLVTAVSDKLLYGRMLPQTRSVILAALPSQRDNIARVLVTLYLVFTSGEYLVHH